MSSYSELSSPPGSVDWELESPVLVGQPHPRFASTATQDRAPPPPDLPATSTTMENPKEDPQLLGDISDGDKKPEKSQSTYTGSQHPGDITLPMIPSCPMPVINCRPPSVTPPILPSGPESAGLEDDVRVGPMPSASPEAIVIVPSVPHIPHTSSLRGPAASYQASSGSILPGSGTPSSPPTKSNDATVRVPAQVHFCMIPEPISPPSPAPSSDISDIIPPRPSLSPISSSSSNWSPVIPPPPNPAAWSIPHSSGQTPSPYFVPPPQPVCGLPFLPQAPSPPYLPCGIPEVIHAFHPQTNSTAGPNSHTISPIPSRRTASSTVSFDVPPHARDEQLWFEDGNIVLNASNVEFRVYKGPLLALSPILKARCEDVRGMSYLPINGDISPDDLRHVLRFVYGDTSRVEPSFSEIAAHIRFGRQYKAEKLLQRSLNYLKKFYVTELAAWLKLPSLDPPLFEPAHAIGVVNLARLLGKDGEALLPIALMRCCMLGAGIVDGFELENGTWEMLSPQDLGRCFEGRVKLLEASVRAAETLRAHTTSDECSRPQRCKAALQRFIAELVGSGDSDNAASGAATRNALCCLRWDLSLSLSSRRAYFQEAGADAVGEEKLCTKCFARQLEEQRKIFARLPQMMGVSVRGWGTKEDAF
ncbi:hypothetical protein GSI_11914 [Ganoderma sinense ZZ0214-1]|uniref:BTB domain-containing protein n=1 Tax=Ganoderma sinense ZZ0214-1 TaxID=1077348 RepID=A0A2G8RXB5_9APHY|nr:hypothetical protein GSI_11914 [Ganoderma sinense ZZ0214-1]